MVIFGRLKKFIKGSGFGWDGEPNTHPDQAIKHEPAQGGAMLKMAPARYRQYHPQNPLDPEPCRHYSVHPKGRGDFRVGDLNI